MQSVCASNLNLFPARLSMSTGLLADEAGSTTAYYGLLQLYLYSELAWRST